MTLTEVLMAAMVSAAAAVGYQSAAFAHRGLVAHAAGLVIGAAIGVAGAKALWATLRFLNGPDRREQCQWLDSWWFNSATLLAMILWVIVVIATSGLVTNAVLRAA